MTNAFNIHLRPCLRCLILLLPCLFLLLVCFWCCRSGIGAGFRFGLGLGRCCWLLSTQPGPRGLGLLPAWAAAERTKELSLTRHQLLPSSCAFIKAVSVLLHGAKAASSGTQPLQHSRHHEISLCPEPGQRWPAFASLNIQVHVPACGKAASRTSSPEPSQALPEGAPAM
ncbi:hypothetical protein PGIGA_G00062910 [Pangasianodon gigas]|uniref:Uncharacterized protein n=1 Tax=Pangasianodon gigas TaxID=30993 RepID=A0ACC5X612_PANGG|nr:hypothetical protein [Pangasianodon gigas]